MPINVLVQRFIFCSYVTKQAVICLDQVSKFTVFERYKICWKSWSLPGRERLNLGSYVVDVFCDETLDLKPLSYQQKVIKVLQRHLHVALVDELQDVRLNEFKFKQYR